MASAVVSVTGVAPPSVEGQVQLLPPASPAPPLTTYVPSEPSSASAAAAANAARGRAAALLRQMVLVANFSKPIADLQAVSCFESLMG